MRVTGFINQVFLILTGLFNTSIYYNQLIIFCKEKIFCYNDNMLKKLRNKKIAKKVWIILGLLIVPAFVLWGLGSAIRTPKESAYVGKIFGKRVSSLEYQDALAAVKNQFIMQLGDDFYQLEKNLNLPAQAWDRLILLYEAKNRKINVSDQEIIELIESYPFFQRNGKFDNRLYEQTLIYFFHTQPRIFEEQTRQNLMLAKLYKQVTDSLNLSEEEIKNEYQKLNGATVDEKKKEYFNKFFNGLKNKAGALDIRLP